MRPIAFLVLFFSLSAYGQGFNFSKQWQYLGPDSIPGYHKKRSDVGIGPVEFIRVHPTKEGHLLAGSLNGGLFFSENRGEQWINAGSDRWDYSACAWADFHPEKPDYWFAVSNKSGSNAKPGKIGKEGGLFRTKSAGSNWETIANRKTFGSDFTTIYGTRFDPENPKRLYMMSSRGLYYTDDCMALIVTWKKVEGVKGWIYDMDFLGGQIYLSNFFKGQWRVISMNSDLNGRPKIVTKAHEVNKPLRTITIEPIGEKLLVLVDQKQGSDQLWEYDPKNDVAELVLNNQRVNFGSGHTLAVNPHNTNEIFIGQSTRVRMYERDSKTKIKLGSDYHVDVEFVAYDPFDANIRYMATHGGMYISYDKGASWESKSKGLGVAEVMGLAVSNTDPNQVVIGCFHDGSSVLADWDKNGTYSWRIVNGGDALTPLIDPTDGGVIYTSNQYTGGGIFWSSDTAKHNSNIHNRNGLKTSGWEMTAVLHPKMDNLLFFNYTRKDEAGKGNIDVCRTADASQKKNAEIISDFGKTHGLKKYKVYGLFNSPFYENELYAYVLHYDKNSENKKTTYHRLFKTQNCVGDADTVINSWFELEIPISTWIGDVETDPFNPNIIYLSYVAGKSHPETMFGDKGLLYALKYKSSNHVLKKEVDITRNIPNTLGGRFNIVIPYKDRVMFVATRTGVWFANERVMKGSNRWERVGHGLPHCKIFGLHYHEKEKILTVGLFGRGVWRYYLTD